MKSIYSVMLAVMVLLSAQTTVLATPAWTGIAKISQLQAKANGEVWVLLEGVSEWHGIVPNAEVSGSRDAVNRMYSMLEKAMEADRAIRLLTDGQVAIEGQSPFPNVISVETLGG